MTDKPIPTDLPNDPAEDPTGGHSAPSLAIPPIEEVPTSESPQPSEEKASRILQGRLLVGVGVILLGLVNFFPRNFYTLSSGEIWRFWPLILVGFGVAKFATAKENKERHGAAWLMATGVVLLIHFLNLFGLDWGTGWPLWIIATGVIDIAFPEKTRDRGMGLFLLALGTFFLLYRTYTLPEGWERGWPLLVIFLGAVLIWQAVFAKPGSSRRHGGRREGRDHG